MRQFPLVLSMLAVVCLLPASSCFSQAVVVERPEFRALVPEDAVVEKLADGFSFTEGPAWNPVEKFLVFSDNVENRIYKLDAGTHIALIFRLPSGMSNGNTYNAKGEFFSCEQEPHRVSITRLDGAMDYLPDQYEGKALSSPNDLVIKSDGTVWFTDPTYGLGKQRQKEQATNNVYCYDPKGKELRAVVTDFNQPNGLCFSPGETKLYIADSGKPRHVRVFDVTSANQLSGGEVFCTIDKGVPDGMRCDTAGNLWSSAGDGVQVFNTVGERLGRIRVPETPANLCFGGVDEQGRTDLYLTARKSLYRVKVTAQGTAAR